MLNDVDGQRVASFTWPSQKPGTKSYQLIISRLQAAAAVLVVFLIAIGFAGIHDYPKPQEERSEIALQGVA